VSRRWLLRLWLLAALAPQAQAQEAWPSKPVRLIVPFAPGSASDSAARIVAHALSQRLGQSVVVDPRPGGSGQIGAAHAARSAPDGYTLLMTSNTTHSANPHLYKTLPYDPLKDFEPVARTGTLPFMLVVPTTLPVSSAAELIAYARARPGQLTYATPNSASLVSAETVNRLAGLDLIRVSYKSSPQALLDLIAGRVQVSFSDFATAMPHVQAGKLRVLAVTTARRSALLPDVPPLADTLKGFDLTSWNGVFVPAGTPRPLVTRLSAEWLAVLAQPEVRHKLGALGYEIDPLGAEAFGQYVREQLAYWGKLVRDAGLQPE
jgi:tripartite-type tricarboxylate transporter receptor subunit TctC